MTLRKWKVLYIHIPGEGWIYEKFKLNNYNFPLRSIINTNYQNLKAKYRFINLDTGLGEIKNLLNDYFKNRGNRECNSEIYEIYCKDKDATILTMINIITDIYYFMSEWKERNEI